MGTSKSGNELINHVIRLFPMDVEGYVEQAATIEKRVHPACFTLAALTTVPGMLSWLKCLL